MFGNGKAAEKIFKAIISINMTVKHTDRIQFIDLAKGICIFLVVAGHVFNNEHTDANLFMISFRMPLYFVLSGLFFSLYGSFREFLVKKVNKLIIPFTAFYLISFIFRIFTNILQGETIEWSKALSICYEDISSNAPIWFLPCLFICGLLFYTITKISKHAKLGVNYYILTLSCIIGGGGFLLGQKGVNLPLWIDSAMTAIPFYAFGYILRKKTKFLETKYNKYALILIAGLSFAYTFCFKSYSALHCNHMCETNPFLYYSCGLIGTMGILLLSKAIDRIPIVSKFGRYSICILLTHYLLITIFTKGVELLGISINDITRLGIYLAIMLSYIVLIPLMVRYLPHICAQKDIIK